MLYGSQGIFRAIMSFWFLPQPVKQVKSKEGEIGLEMLSDIVQATQDLWQMPTLLSVFISSPVSTYC